MTVLSLKPKYVPLIQKPNCCAAACLQMIIFRNGHGLHDQEEIAASLGVRVAETNTGAFRHEMGRMTSVNDEGISTVESVPIINDIFRLKRMALVGEAVRYREIGSFGELVASALKDGHDLQVEHHSHEVHPENPVNVHIHDSLVESFDTVSGLVTLIDPVPRRQQRQEVHIGVLARSIGPDFGKELGAVLIRKL